jgi:hypothetical protein
MMSAPGMSVLLLSNRSCERHLSVRASASGLDPTTSSVSSVPPWHEPSLSKTISMQQIDQMRLLALTVADAQEVADLRHHAANLRRVVRQSESIRLRRIPMSAVSARTFARGMHLLRWPEIFRSLSAGTARCVF